MTIEMWGQQRGRPVSHPHNNDYNKGGNQSLGGKHMSMNELERKVNKLRELRRMQDELAAEISATEDELKAYMAANNADTLHGPSFKITWKEVASSRLDSKALKAAAPTIWEQFTRTTTTRRFIVA